MMPHNTFARPRVAIKVSVNMLYANIWSACTFPNFVDKETVNAKLYYVLLTVVREFQGHIRG